MPKNERSLPPNDPSRLMQQPPEQDPIFPMSYKAANRPPCRVVLYSHDTLGFGHLRRNLMLAERLKALSPEPEVLLIAGTSEAGAFALPPGVDLITLPAYAKQSCGTYRPRRLAMSLAELRDLRAGIIKSAVKSMRPDLFIADNVPLGAQGELEPALRWMAKEPGIARALGLRDVLDDRQSVRAQWTRDRNVEAVNDYYDHVWVYGDPRVCDPVADCGLAGMIRARVSHTGYLLRPVPPVTPEAGAPYALCTVGGGRDGAAVLEAFVSAPLPAGMRGIVVTGSQLDDGARTRIEAAAAERPDMEVRRFVPDLMPLLAGAARVVAMGGYNTVCEVLRLGKPALIVPRVRPRQEQLVRAERFAALGLIDMLHPDVLSPDALGAWMARPAPGATSGRLDTGGLDRFAELAAAAMADPRAALPGSVLPITAAA
jgi:predicted glycosyltransferase